MSARHDFESQPPPDPRSGALGSGALGSGDSLEARLAAAFSMDAAPADLADRIVARTVADLRQAAENDATLGRRLDGMLVPDSVVPADLEPRVHAASVGGLPITAEPILGYVGEPDRSGVAGRIRTTAGRLAMAASFGVLALAGWWTTQPATEGPTPVPVRSLLAAEVTEFTDVSWAAADGADAIEAELALLEDWDVGSYADVADEIEAMIPDFLLADPGN